MIGETVVSVKELSRLLSCSVITIRRLSKAGDIPAPIVSNIRKSEWRRSDFDHILVDRGLPLLTAAQVADQLGVTESWVHALSRNGKLPSQRLGSRTVRWRLDTVEAYSGVPTPKPQPEESALSGKLRIVNLCNPNDGRWYPIVVVERGFDTEDEALAAIAGAGAKLGGPRVAPSASEPAPPSEATPPALPDPASAPQPDIGSGLAREADGWGARPTSVGHQPAGPGRNSAERVGAAGAVDTDIKGTVKFFDTMKGFGFVEPDDGSRDVFVHAILLERLGVSPLLEGERVTVTAGDTAKGRQATAIARLSE